jgi:SAM-dependent methyltransferase
MRSFLYRKADRYDRMLKWLHGDTVGERFGEIATRIGEGRRVLDLGAGTCALAEYLHPTCSYLGAELNAEFRAHAAARGLEVIELNVFDFAAYPQSIDVVVAADLLHHLVPSVNEFLRGLGASRIPLVVICESYPYGASLFTKIFGPILDNDGVNNLPARLRHHLFDEFTEERLRRDMRAAFPGRESHFNVLSERTAPGKEKRGWDTMIASFQLPEGQS